MLTNKGYQLEISKLDKQTRKKIKKDLTVVPHSYIGTELPYMIFKYDNEYVYLPRYYGIMNFSNGHKKNCNNYLLPGLKIDINITLPNFKLKPIQKASYVYILNSLSKYGTGIVKLNCGVGKTVLTIYTISKLKYRALIVVHRVNLIKQWKDEIQKFTNAKVGLIHRNTIDIENKDIILTTVHTIIQKDNYQKYYQKFGIVVFDECHHLNAREFCKALKRINTQFILGLTATPNKGETMKINHVFKQFIGPIIPPDSIINKYTTNNSNTGNVICNILRYSVDNGNYCQHLMHDFANKPNTGGMITNIANNDNRSDMIIHYINKLVNESQRSILVVGDRKYQLRYISQQLDKLNISNGLYIGGMAPSELENSKNKKVILGTYAICEEGLNIVKLNAIILATPRRNNEQAIGRVLRQQHQIAVLMIDIIDTFSNTFVNQGRARKRIYKKANYLIKELKIKDNKNYPNLITKIN